jgi:hypothetical protein
MTKSSSETPWYVQKFVDEGLLLLVVWKAIILFSQDFYGVVCGFAEGLLPNFR